ncbi:hypothetical protein JOC95_001789 [Bacillus tianshenii]|uniref:Uncharacterized protein n=1 Tax=Sutcliffiella tianshenii TaxID=1463404 RepID=A0ABS2NZW2_9BACI|nr:hypothetical protein [Bacillus tianshenii]MBM7619937.1 hypothetical protein [Bacillus tianshenii]
MEKQQQLDNKPSSYEMDWYWVGFLVLVGLWIISFGFSSLIEPLDLLLLRLALNGVIVAYFLIVLIIYRYLSWKKPSKYVIIRFNGKEVGRM